MRRAIAPLVVTALALLLTADAEGRVVATAIADQAPEVAKKERRTINPESFRSSVASMSLEVPDPVKAHAEAERLVVKLGGEVTSSSSSTESAHLSARVGERRLQGVVDALQSTPGRVSNVSRHMNDFASTAKMAAERLRRLDLADAELVRAIKSASDSDAVDGLMMLRELSQTERQSQENQIESLRQESDRAHIHVSFSVLR